MVNVDTRVYILDPIMWQLQGGVPRKRLYSLDGMRVPAPPSPALPGGEITIAEMKATLVTSTGGSTGGDSSEQPNRALDQYVAAGGEIYPVVTVPKSIYGRATDAAAKRAFQLYQNPQSAQSTAPITLTSIISGIAKFITSKASGSGGAVSSNRKRPAPVSEPAETSLLGDISSPLRSSSALMARGDSSSSQPAVAAIRTIAIHPFRPFLSVSVNADGGSSVYGYDLSSQQWSTLVLSAQPQSHIQCMAYNPMGGSVLAVGCSVGVCLWQFVFPNSIPTAAGAGTGLGSSGISARNTSASLSTSIAGGALNTSTALLQLSALVTGDDVSAAARTGSTTAGGVRHPTSANLTVLKSEGLKDVSEVAFSPNGRFLIACTGSGAAPTAATTTTAVLDTSALDSKSSAGDEKASRSVKPAPLWQFGTIVIFDVAKAVTGHGQGITPLRVIGGAPNLIRYCGSGTHFVVSTPHSSLFTLFETRTYTHKSFDAGCPVSTAAWNRDGSILLVGSSQSTRITAIHFTASAKTLDDRVTLDVSPIEFDYAAVTCDGTGESGKKYRVGGTVHQIVWSPNNDRLVVSFTGEEDGSELLAVFATAVDLIVSFRPLGFIRGPPTGGAPTSTTTTASAGALLPPLTPDHASVPNKPLFATPSPAPASVADAKYGGASAAAIRRRASASKLGRSASGVALDGIDENTSDEPAAASNGPTESPSVFGFTGVAGATPKPAPKQQQTRPFSSAPFRKPAINKATSLQFVPQFADGALLVVGWRDGQITAYPFYTNPLTAPTALSNTATATSAAAVTNSSLAAGSGATAIITPPPVAGGGSASLLPAWWIPSTHFGYGLGDASGRSERQSFADALAAIQPTLPDWTPNDSVNPKPKKKLKPNPTTATNAGAATPVTPLPAAKGAEETQATPETFAYQQSEL